MMSKFLTTGQMIDRLKVGEVAEGSTHWEVKRLEDGSIVELNDGEHFPIIHSFLTEAWTIEGVEIMSKSINKLCLEAYETAKSKGWHDEPRETGTILALIHSEVSEALEADRKGDQENFAEELADVCIRVFDLCGSKGIDLETEVYAKMLINTERSYKHGGKSY